MFQKEKLEFLLLSMSKERKVQKREWIEPYQSYVKEVNFSILENKSNFYF